MKPARFETLTSGSPSQAAMRWQQATRLLCIRLDTLGDVLMTTPAIRALKRVVPGRRVTLLTSRAGAQAARLVPEIDDVLVYEAPWMKASPGRSNPREGLTDRAIASRLREAGFDGSVIFTVYSQSPLPAALLCHWSDIPLRLAHCRENPYQLLTDWVPETEPETQIRHEVRRQLDLVAAVGARCTDERLSLRVPPETMASVKELLTALLDRTRPWVVIHPGASAASRRYPPEHFGTMGRLLVRDLGCQVLFTGTASERPLVEAIQQAMGAPSQTLAGVLSLGQCAALLSLAPLLISNNTGPVHIAAAVGTPVVVLYALTNPQHTPWQVPNRVLFHDVACKYCYKSVCPEGHHDCLRLVEPDVVVRAATELLEHRMALSAESLEC
jgi:lipopolysaccharide heptosyltransferase II